MRKASLILSTLLLFSVISVPAYAIDRETFVKASIETLRTLDPAVAYDSTGNMRILNLYETLIAFDGAATNRFVPVVATAVPSVENGGIADDGRTYTFEIRKGIRFHNGDELTPEDVVYTFKRNMVTDPVGGPVWMILEALTGTGSSREGGSIRAGIMDKIDRAVEAKGNKVIFHLPAPYPPFLGILTYPANVILDKKWAVANGCWDGKMTTAAKYNNPPAGSEPLQSIENGSGAYRMKLWEQSKQFVFERFDGYWGPAPKIKTAIVKYVPEWSTRKMMLQNGDADNIGVENSFVPELRAIKGLTLHRIPQLSVTGAMFCQRINPTGNPNIGSGKLDGRGIPPDFFSDKEVRLAMSHLLDRETYLADVTNNLAIMPSSPNIQGLPHHRKVPVNGYDLEKARAYMKKAWKGQAWEKGFEFTIVHNTGNVLRENIALMLAENIRALNPKFRVEVRSVMWADYLVAYRAANYPIFIIGWGADYPDPHNFLYPFMHSNGSYGRVTGARNPEIDNLLKLGIETVDPAKRDPIYAKLQNLWHEEVLGIAVVQPLLVKAYRDNVHGFAPNPMYGTEHEILKSLRKE